MTLYKRREAFSGLSLRVGTAFSRLGPGPNFWTGLSLLLATAAFVFLTQQLFLGAAAAMIIAAFFDFVDGSVARAKLAASRMGAYLDTVTDRYVEAIIIFGMVLVVDGSWS